MLKKKQVNTIGNRAGTWEEKWQKSKQRNLAKQTKADGELNGSNCLQHWERNHVLREGIFDKLTLVDRIGSMNPVWNGKKNPSSLLQKEFSATTLHLSSANTPQYVPWLVWQACLLIKRWVRASGWRVQNRTFSKRKWTNSLSWIVTLFVTYTLLIELMEYVSLPNTEDCLKCKANQTSFRCTQFNSATQNKCPVYICTYPLSWSAAPWDWTIAHDLYA